MITLKSVDKYYKKEKTNKKLKRSERKIPLICPICGTEYNYKGKICQECIEKSRKKTLPIDAFLNLDNITFSRSQDCDINTTVVSQKDDLSFLVSNYILDGNKPNEL